MTHPMSESWVDWRRIGERTMENGASAPWDGKPVLVVDDGIVSEAYYHGETVTWWLAQSADGDFDPSRPIFPTHWAPMPAPPETGL